MNTRPIIVTCIFISFAGLLFLSEVRARLNGAHEQEKVARFWKDRVGQEQLKKLVIMGRFADFKQEVATLIPGAFPNLKSKTEKARLRDLASVIPHETQYSVSLGYSADAMLVSGKEMVKKRKYKDGVRMLQQLIDQFPDSYHVVEAHYLITEAF
ncbi:MAG: hypothetical protein KDD33_06715 [Bdellovibrionales bacterium]|nr:hypothetical protein [Bdellovibrionales bacterium]